MHFYSINNTIEYTSRRFLTYYIQINGLLNITTVISTFFNEEVEFQFTVRDLKARVLWSYYVGGLIPKIPWLKEIDLQIDELLLAGNFQTSGQLSFFNHSQLHFIDKKNSSMKTRMLKKTFEPIVLQSIQQSIEVEFKKIRRRKH